MCKDHDTSWKDHDLFQVCSPADEPEQKWSPKSDYYVFKENFSRLSAKSINSISENDRDEQSVAGMCHPMCKTCMFFECTCC